MQEPVETQKQGEILIVDDEPQVRDILSRWLEAEGYRCVVVANVDDAWQVLEDKGNFSLVITDVMMPEQSGASLFEMVRERYPKMKVIVMSGLIDEPNTVADLLRRGASAFFNKPFDRNAVIENVAKALQTED